jgi:GxxExxY protein
MHIELIEKDITRDVIGAFFEVYNALGYGFLEFVYSLAMERELLRRGHTVEREVSVPVMYKGELLTIQRVDMIVDRKVVVENKAGPILPVTSRLQALSYVRSTSLEVGLVLHFGPEAKFYRVVHTNTGNSL